MRAWAGIGYETGTSRSAEVALTDDGSLKVGF
jgi:hypothetical protein